MRHRKNSESEEGSEMEIDGEAKTDNQDDVDEEEEKDEMMPQDEEDSDDEDEQQAVASGSRPADDPFMDSFYGLGSSNPVERAQAAQIMLLHCLLGPSANAKDAAYALRRLLNGLCSGRAAARQGNASALASFLKIAFRMDKIDEIRNESSCKNNDGENNEAEETSDLMYIRERLMAATDPSQISCRKKGSEERDYQFGRLFGILGIVRSNILRPVSRVDSEVVKEVANALIDDLVELFWLKKWMREPAAHGIATMLKLFFEAGKDGRRVAEELIVSVVIPKLLTVTQEQRDEEELDRQKLMKGFCAEQISVAAYIQSQDQTTTFPFPLDEAVVSSSTLPLIGQALSETSSVVHPRTHFTWEALWMFLTEKQRDDETGDVSYRQLREKIPFGDESPQQVINAIIKIVVKEKLLRMESDMSTKKATHERRSLALCIVKHLSGVPFSSSLAGQNQIVLNGDLMETILLTPDIIQALFLNVIAGGKQKQKASLLKPLALEVLGTITEAASEVGNGRSLSCAKAFLNCDLRFDTHTKTSTVSDLLRFSSEKIPSEADCRIWDEYIDYLETRFLECCNNHSDAHAPSHKLAVNYAELLHSAAKNILRAGVDVDGDNDMRTIEYKWKSVKKILDFFMAVAFFDCSGLSPPSEKKKKKKCKKKSLNSGVEAALRVGKSIPEGGEIPYSVRATVAARFFSLTSDYSMAMARESKEGSAERVEKDTNTLAVLADLCSSWKQLEVNGAKRFDSATKSGDNDDNDDDDKSFDPEAAITELHKRVIEIEKSTELDSENSENQSRRRCCTGIAVLAMTLYLHRLHCGSNNSMEEDPDADEEDDEEEICNALDGLKSVAEEFSSKELEGLNPLLGLAELCANILSSPLGSGTIGRGSSPKLVREAVKFAWFGGLRMASSMATEEKSLLDSPVIDTLMEAIGANEGQGGSPEDDGLDDGSERNSVNDESDDEEDIEADEGVFAKAAKILDEPDNTEIEDLKRPSSDDEDSEMEIEASKLQTMLEEDSDADVDATELEHHEGADAALAKLIKLKQEARKAGQQAREKIEVSNQLRCTLLIEILLGRPDAWNHLFRGSILEMVMPILLHRKRVAAMVQKAIDSGAKIGTGEKKALLEKLTSLIKQKLCKLRLLSMPGASPVNAESGEKLLKQILTEARKAKDKEQVSCCSSCSIFVLRAMKSTPEMTFIVSREYGQIVLEWSTRRSRGASMFEDLINQMPTMAQATLIPSLLKATFESRSLFLRIEALRLLSLLFATTPDQSASELDKLAASAVKDSENDLIEMLTRSLHDESMATPKTVRTILKSIEKILPGLSAALGPDVLGSLETLKSVVRDLGSQENLNSASAKCVDLIEKKITDLQSAKSASRPNESTTEKGSLEGGSRSKKSKKKKKKKK
jgi:hypothetical protein